MVIVYKYWNIENTKLKYIYKIKKVVNTYRLSVWLVLLTAAGT
jgi:hypothetical protein